MATRAITYSGPRERAECEQEHKLTEMTMQGRREETELERLLRLAFCDPSHTETFLHRFLSEFVIVIKDDRRTAEEAPFGCVDARNVVMSDGTYAAACFTSERAVHDAFRHTKTAHWNLARVPALVVLSGLPEEMPLIVNPGSEYGVTFDASDRDVLCRRAASLGKVVVPFRALH